eukprot:scaffold17327_cov67-Attheya_sp.AAC.8
MDCCRDTSTHYYYCCYTPESPPPLIKLVKPGQYQTGAEMTQPTQKPIGIHPSIQAAASHHHGEEDTMCSRNIAAEEDRLAIRCRTPGGLSELPMVADDDAHTAM